MARRVAPRWPPPIHQVQKLVLCDHDGVELFHQLGVGVRVAVGEVADVVGVEEADLERGRGGGGGGGG